MAHTEPSSRSQAAPRHAKKTAIRVMVVDDHPSLARGVELSLQRAEDIEVVGVLHRPSEVLSRVEELIPDVVLMDIRMPQREGIDLLIQISSLMPQVKVIMLSGSDDPQDIRDAMRLGAYGYVSKRIAWDQLIPIVRMAQQDQVVISRKALDPVLGRVLRGEFNLTDGEIELLRNLVEVENLSEVAKRVSMAPSTLSRNLKRIQDKLGAKTRLEAAVIAAKAGLV